MQNLEETVKYSNVNLLNCGEKKLQCVSVLGRYCQPTASTSHSSKILSNEGELLLSLIAK